MKLQTAQWNIGGGKIRMRGGNPEREQTYSVEGLAYISDVISRFKPDIVTLQETHSSNGMSQTEEIASRLGYPYLVNDEYDDSHIEEGQRLGQAVISQFPFVDHSFNLYHNPGYTIKRPDGKTWKTHDKGVSSCIVRLPNGLDLNVKTTHLFPFTKFGKDPFSDEVAPVREDIINKLQPGGKIFLIQGDFNVDRTSLSTFIGRDHTQVDEVFLDKPTTPSGKRYDHVLYGGLQLMHTKIFTDALTDHYPIFSEFEIAA